MAGAANRHASVVLVADRCVMIMGPAGSGKTALALALIAHCRALGVFAQLVADDQVFISTAGARAIVAAPASIAGLAEVRGFGPAVTAHEPKAVVDLLVDLVSRPAAPRFDPDGTLSLEGVVLPHLRLAERDGRAAVLAVAAKLHLPPFR